MNHRNFIRYFLNEEIYLVDSMDPADADAPATKDIILVVVPASLSEEDESFLFKVFASVNIAPDELAVSTENYVFSNHSMAFFFGTELLEFNPGNYQPEVFDDCTVIKAHSLEEIAGDDNKKRALWQVLKSSFD